MKKHERAALLAATLVMCALLSWHKSLTWVEGQTDNVYVAELVDNISTRGLPLTQVNRSVMQAQSLGLWQMKAEDLCAQALKFAENREYNYFRWHPYVVLYLLAPFAWLSSGPVVISSAIAIVFVVFLSTVYVFVRARDVEPLGAVAFCALVMSHPAWYQSLQGQVYPDRVFMLSAVLLVAAVFLGRLRWWLVCVCVLASVIVTERTGIISGAFLCGVALLYGDRLGKLRWPIAALGVGAIGYSFAWIKLYIQYAQTEGFSNNFLWPVIKAHLSTPAFVDGLIVFAVVNFAFLGLFAFAAPRALLIVVGLMVPNILGSVGGAEKTSWLTHYHTMYFPFLVWASAEGYARFARNGGPRAFRFVVPAVTIAIALTSACLVPAVNVKSMSFSLTQLGSQPIVRALREIPLFVGDHPARPVFRAVALHARELIPKGATVTTFEGMMPSLYGWADLYYYPDGLADADFAVVTVEKNRSGEQIFGGQWTNLGALEYAKQSECLTDRLRGAGYLVESPVVLGGSGAYALLRRNR